LGGDQICIFSEFSFLIFLFYLKITNWVPNPARGTPSGAADVRKRTYRRAAGEKRKAKVNVKERFDV